MISRQNQVRIRSAILLASLCLVVVIVSVWLIQREGGESDELVEWQDQEPTDKESVDSTPEFVEQRATSMDKPNVLPANNLLSPLEVIDNPNCVMRMGTGQASDLALVVVPDPNGARFSVVSQTGALYGGKLPFFPNHYKLGKRANGSIVVGFGELLLNQKGNNGPEAREPVRVYVDGQLVYEQEKLSWFDVASDGSSYAAIEPLGGGMSQLLIHNLNEGTQSQHYLGNVYHSDSYELPYLATYSIGFGEVHLVPINGASELGIGTHYFYPVQSAAKPRRVRAIAESSYDFAHLTSSWEGFFFYSEASDNGAGPFRVIKRELDWATGKFVDAWSLHIQAGIGQGGVSFSNNGRWIKIRTSPLGLPSMWNRNAFRTYVFDTLTGERVFEFPLLSGQEQFMRLASVMSAGSTLDDMGRFGGLEIRGDQLMMFRTFDDPDHPGGFRGIYDVFDMNTIQADSQPDFRVAVNRTPSNRCASRSYPRALQAQDGSLVFAPVTQ